MTPLIAALGFGPPPEAWVALGAPSPPGTVVAARAPDGAVALLRPFDVGGPTALTVDPDGVTHPPFAVPDHRVVLVAAGDRWVGVHEGEARIWTRDGELLAQATLPAPCFGPVFAVDGGVRVPCAGAEVRLDGAVTTAASTLTLPDGDVLQLDRALQGSLSRTGQVGWTVDTALSRIAPSPDGRWLVAGNAVLDAATGERVSPTELHAWRPDGALAGVGRWGGLARDPATGRHLPRPDGHGGPVIALAWSPDADRLATSGADRVVLVWDPAGGPPLARLELAEPVTGLWWQDDGRLLIGTLPEGGQRTVHRWDPDAAEPEGRWVVEARPGIAVGRGGRFAAVVDGQVVVVGPEDAAEQTWQPPLGRIDRVAWVRDRWLVVGGGRLWSLGRERPLALGVADVLPARDGRSAWLDHGGWTAPCRPCGGHPGDLPAAPPPLPGQRSASGAISSDGRWLATTGEGDGVVWVAPIGPAPSSRPPRDVAVVVAGRPGLDGGRVLEALRVGRVPGDRVTWLAPGQDPEPGWVEVGDRGALERLGPLRPWDDPDLAGEAVCRAAALLEADPERIQALVVEGVSVPAGCAGAGSKVVHWDQVDAWVPPWDPLQPPTTRSWW